MTIKEKIHNFINEMDYINNEHCLGVLFYGSYLTGFNTSTSDIDLHIIFDNSNPEHLIRGNKIIDGTRIEYFEKPIGDIYLTIEDDYHNQNIASLLIFGKSEIIYERDSDLSELRQYTINRFRDPLPPLSANEAREQVSIINNRMEKLGNYAQEDNPYFEHLYHLTIEKIRRFYHNLIGSPRIDTYKGFRIYTDEKYRKAFCIDKLPEQFFIDLYFEAITNQEMNSKEKYELISRIYDFAKRNVILDKDNHRIPVKSRNEGFDTTIIKPTKIEKKESIQIPIPVLKRVLKFIKEMGYIQNEHCLGLVVYGSSLTGFSTLSSDIDLHIIFDDTDPNHIIRGSRLIDGTRIEYFEKPLRETYLAIEYDYLNQNNALYPIIGKGTIVFERNREISKLQQYAIDRFSTPMPPLSEDDAMEQISIINNRMEKLEQLAISNNPHFDHFYHLVIERIRKFYHKALGISKIPTSKVYRIYTDEAYRNSMYKDNPDQEFVDMYLYMISFTGKNKLEKFQMVKKLYQHAIGSIDLGDNYRIAIKSRNTSNLPVPTGEPKPYAKEKILNNNE